jgi:hypothetical protein
MKPTLTIQALQQSALEFTNNLCNVANLYGITDGKAVGTYIEHQFTDYLANIYDFELGNAAMGIDFPSINVDLKVTSIKQPQSSCPFKSAAQKIFGLGYHLIIFVYEKTDNHNKKMAQLKIHHIIFVDKKHTGDFQTTKGLLEIIKYEGNQDDIVGFLFDKNLPIDEITANQLAQQILTTPPEQGYLTISNALQWRLQYARVIQKAGDVIGIIKIN